MPTGRPDPAPALVPHVQARAVFQALAAARDAARDAGPARRSLALVDIDRLSCLNARYGTDVGDEVLRLASVVLVEGVQGLGRAGYWSGDQFVVFIPDLPATEATRRVGVLLDRLRATSTELPCGAVSASAGGITTTGTEQGAWLVEMAARALRRAKETRGTVDWTTEDDGVTRVRTSG